MRPAPGYIAIVNPDGKRWQTYAPELLAFWRERGIEPEIEIVPWREVVPRDGDLDGLAAFEIGRRSSAWNRPAAISR